MKTYYELQQELKQIDTLEKAEKYIEENVPTDEFDSLHEYLNHCIAEKNISVSDLIQDSGLNKNYAYNIINGNKQNPARDKIIALCIGLKLSIEESAAALRIAGKTGFHLEIARDIWIIGALKCCVGNVDTVNRYLTDHNIQPLDI